MRLFLTMAVVVLPVALGACAIQRAQEASDAQTKMIGLSKEQVLACMGPPAAKAVEGTTEVWSYNSGNNQTTVNTFSTSNTNASVSGNRNFASGQASTTSTGFGTARSRFCTVNVTMVNGAVSRMNYVGPTGGLLTQGEQCAFAVENCLK
jgi:hypothetical protein